jgi:hypothetical protein
LAFKVLGIEVRRGIIGTVAEAVESYPKGETVPLGQERFCEQYVNTDELHHEKEAFQGRV